MNFRKSIFTAASPNTQKDDVKRAVKMLLMPWKWYNEKYNTEFAKELKKYLSIEHVELVESLITKQGIVYKRLARIKL